MALLRIKIDNGGRMAKDALGIQSYVEKMFDKSPQVRLDTGLVVSHDSYGYTIKVKGISYSGKLANATIGTLNVNDTVKVLSNCANGIYSDMFILCKLIG